MACMHSCAKANIALTGRRAGLGRGGLHDRERAALQMCLVLEEVCVYAARDV